MRMICIGERRLTPEFIQVFAQQMQFSAEEMNHLTLLALYEKAKTNSQRQLYLEKIIESLETKENRVEIKNYVEFLSSPILPLLQLILSFNDIDGKLEVMCRTVFMQETACTVMVCRIDNHLIKMLG